MSQETKLVKCLRKSKHYNEYTMPINKNAFIRYKILDKCFSAPNWYKKPHLLIRS